MTETQLLFRWGVNLGYSEWRPDQPHEDWSGHLEIEGGTLRRPRQVIYHGLYAPQQRTPIELPTPAWTSPRLNISRRAYGYQGCEGLLVEVQGDADTRIRFRSGMLTVAFTLGDLPEGDWLTWPAGAKYSCSELTVCRIEDDGIYWNPRRAAAATATDGLRRLVLGLDRFRGDFLPRDLHHQTCAWVPPGAGVSIPFRWESDRPAIATWRFTASAWEARSDSLAFDRAEIVNSAFMPVATSLDGRDLARPTYRAKYFRGAYAALEHVDELGRLDASGEHTLTIANHSNAGVFLVLKSAMVQDRPRHWDTVRDCLPFKAEWFDGTRPSGDSTRDLPSGGRGVMVGYDTNMMAAENLWIDAVVRYLAATGAGNFIILRTETDRLRAEDWRRLFALCREKQVHFVINTNNPGSELTPAATLALAAEIGGPFFLGAKQHELSLPMYAGWDEYPAGWGRLAPDKVTSATTLDAAEDAYLGYIRKAYSDGPAGVKRILGEAMLAHRYAYKAGVDCILSETMTGNTALLLSEARGAARAYRPPFWGVHIACHLHCAPETWRHERMFWLNLYLSYLAGASVVEDEEGALAKVHSFVSGPSDPLPAKRQATMAEFFRWARAHPRATPLAVEIGLVYGRHEVLTGGMSLNTKRPVRVWEAFGPAAPEWEYGRPERGWLLADVFMPGVWLGPVLQEPQRLRRWFAGTPYGQVDIVPVEADNQALAEYRLLLFPGWNTMTDGDLERLSRYVGNGGTLVLGLPHLQTSADRTAVLSRGAFTFPAAERVERLCGVRMSGRSRPVDCARALGTTWQLAHPEDGPLCLAEVDVRGAAARTVLAAEGLPLLVEHRLGAGRVYTCTALDYFGHRGLLPLLRGWLQGFLNEFPFGTRLSGGDGEVAFFVYPEGERRQVYLINTDWTVPGNEKACRIGTGGAHPVPVTAREGAVAEVMLV